MAGVGIRPESSDPTEEFGDWDWVRFFLESLDEWGGADWDWD